MIWKSAYHPPPPVDRTSENLRKYVENMERYVGKRNMKGNVGNVMNYMKIMKKYVKNMEK